ncbi:hypothetical protein EYR40_010485 [Pleurotus pulmonarius]|nr:hypothetical protein EYR36_010129 [Pleurotus pulmonarius]KAF4588930.1 hypothetical protein EYR40_010485 [Pleurotus pulmonarius]
MAAAFFERWTDPPVSRLYIDKIFITSSRYANRDPASSIEPGDFGLHDKKTGEFLKEGSIFPHESTKECAAQKLSISDGATDHPRTLQGDLSHIPRDRLHGKHLVTEVVKCLDYFMFFLQQECVLYPPADVL